MSDLSQYVDAVAKRRAITKGGGVNVAILMQLEECDIPLLLEITRLYDQCLSKVIDHVDEKSEEGLTGEDAVTMAKWVAVTHLRIEELASHGSKAKWGEHVEEEIIEPGDGTAKTVECEDDGN